MRIAGFVALPGCRKDRRNADGLSEDRRRLEISDRAGRGSLQRVQPEIGLRTRPWTSASSFEEDRLFRDN